MNVNFLNKGQAGAALNSSRTLTAALAGTILAVLVYVIAAASLCSSYCSTAAALRAENLQLQTENQQMRQDMQHKVVSPQTNKKDATKNTFSDITMLLNINHVEKVEYNRAAQKLVVCGTANKMSDVRGCLASSRQNPHFRQAVLYELRNESKANGLASQGAVNAAEPAAITYKITVKIR